MSMTETQPASKSRRTVLAVARELLADEPDFEARLHERQLVKLLDILRAFAGMSQKELAAKLGCTQSKISKLESGVDADLRFGDIATLLGSRRTRGQELRDPRQRRK